MQLELWLKQATANSNHDKRKRGRMLLRLGPWIIIGGIFLYALHPIRMIKAWPSLSSAQRLAELEGIGLYFAIFIPIYLLLYFIMPGKRTGLTGWQHRQMRKQEDALAELFETVYTATPQPVIFRDEDYRLAAEKLRSFRPLRLPEAQALINEPWFKILVLSGAIEPMNASVIKLVSIKSIEQDREAGFDEE